MIEPTLLDVIIDVGYKEHTYLLGNEWYLTNFIQRTDIFVGKWMISYEFY